MSLEFAHGAIQWLAADAATTTYTISGLSFRPKALRFYWMGLGSSTDTASNTTHLRRGMGFAAGITDRRCVSIQDQDAADPMVCSTSYRDDCVAMTVTSTPAVDGRLDLDAINFDGFVAVVDLQVPVDITVFWEAWGGSDINVATTLEIAEPAATGNQDYTVTGFVSGSNNDQIVMFAGVQETGSAPSASRNDSGFVAGFAGGNGLGNILIHGNSDDNSANSDTDGYGLSSECLAMIVVGGGNPDARATLTQFNTDGFRLNWIARAVTGRKYIALAIKGGLWAVGEYTIDGATLNATATVSGLAFAPKGLCLISKISVESTPGTAPTTDRIALGTGTSTTSRRSQECQSVNSSAAAAILLGVEYDQVLFFVTTAAAVDGAFDINAMNSDGFQIITDDAGSIGTQWHGYMTFGDAPISYPVLPGARRHIFL